MDKTALVASATSLKDISSEAAASFEAVTEACAAALTAALRQRPDLETIIGAGNLPVMESNHINHFKYMGSTSALFDPASFVETVLWVVRTYRARGFTVSYWDIMLPLAMNILQTTLRPPHFEEVAPFYRWLTDNIETIARLSETEPSVYETLGGLHGEHC